MTTHCFLHREELFAEIARPELKAVVDVTVKMVSYTKRKPLRCRQFAILCDQAEAEQLVTFIQYNSIHLSEIVDERIQ